MIQQQLKSLALTVSLEPLPENGKVHQQYNWWCHQCVGQKIIEHTNQGHDLGMICSEQKPN